MKVVIKMIENKEDYRQWLHRDMREYYAYSRKVRFFYWLFRDPYYYIAKYIRLLRQEEYHANCEKSGSIYHILMCWIALSRKNKLGNLLGYKIPRNCIGPGLSIYHHGQIIINENARIGADCHLHGANCIGNDGRHQVAPQIGDGLDLGYGACIIGDVTLGNSVTVGANAVVVRSVEKNSVTLVGVPAREK